jgi:penicillin-binding protein 2
VITGIGQGYFLVTPLQLAHAVATLANRGNALQPTVIYRIDGSGSEKGDPPAIAPKPGPKILMPPEYWDSIIEAMTEVVHGRGTASRAGQGAAYRFAGKTGTAQVFGIKQNQTVSKKVPEHLQDHAWFIAFAPADHPRIAVTALVENGGHGSQAAAPIARKLFDHFLLAKNQMGKTEGVASLAHH